MSGEAQESDGKRSLEERVKAANRKRKLPPREGHEVSADGKEVRTPERDEFFGTLDKASKPEK